MADFETKPPPSGQAQQQGLSEADLKHHSQELGVLGKLWGGVAEKPGNIAGLVIVVSFIAIVLVLWAPESATLPKKDVFTVFVGIITLTLGFLFGRTTSK